MSTLNVLAEAAKMVEYENDGQQESVDETRKTATKTSSSSSRKRGAQPHVISLVDPTGTCVINNITLHNCAGESSMTDQMSDQMFFKQSRPGGRQAHNTMEKNRRAHMKICFDGLQHNVPAVSCLTRASNVSILTEAVNYLKELRDQELSYLSEKSTLHQSRRYLEAQLRLLREMVTNKCTTATSTTTDTTATSTTINTTTSTDTTANTTANTTTATTPCTVYAVKYNGDARAIDVVDQARALSHLDPASRILTSPVLPERSIYSDSKLDSMINRSTDLSSGLSISSTPSSISAHGGGANLDPSTRNFLTTEPSPRNLLTSDGEVVSILLNDASPTTTNSISIGHVISGSSPPQLRHQAAVAAAHNQHFLLDDSSSPPPPLEFTEPPPLEFTEPPPLEFSEPPPLEFTEPLPLDSAEPPPLEWTFASTVTWPAGHQPIGRTRKRLILPNGLVNTTADADADDDDDRLRIVDDVSNVNHDASSIVFTTMHQTSGGDVISAGGYDVIIGSAGDALL